MNTTIAGAQHVESKLMRESLVDKNVLARTESQVLPILPDVNVVQIGGRSIIDRGYSALKPILDEIVANQAQHRMVIGVGSGVRLPAMLAAARGAVFNGIPPYGLWEHPPAVGKLPPHGSDAGSYLVAEVFGARSLILLKDVDGIYTEDPKTNPRAELIRETSVEELIRRQIPTLPVEPSVLDLMTCARLAKKIRIVNGLVRDNLTRV